MKLLAILIAIIGNVILCSVSRHAGDVGEHTRAFLLWVSAVALSCAMGLFVATERKRR